MALVVLLKGMNVGGHRTFRPTLVANELKRLDVVNVGAAGTFVIRKTVAQAKLRAELNGLLPFATEVMICDGRDVVRLANADPFAGQPSRRDIIQFVSVLAKRCKLPSSIPMDLPGEGRWCLRILGCQDRFVFGLYRREMQAIRHLDRLEKVFGVPATTRNWNTIQAVVRILKNTDAV